MIVKRKFVQFNQLLNDEKTKDLYENITKGLNDDGYWNGIKIPTDIEPLEEDLQKELNDSIANL